MTMVPNPQFAGGPQIAESAEALERQRACEAHDAEMNAKYEDPRELQRQKDELCKALYGGPFVEPKKQEETQIASTGEDSEKTEQTAQDSGAEKTQERILSRLDKSVGEIDSQENPLTNPESRNENKATATNLFFREDKLAPQLAQSGGEGREKNTEVNRNWLEANIGVNGPLKPGYERILGNCIIPTGIDASNISEGENAAIVNDCLSDAFVLEIQEHTLAGRVNYPREKVASLIAEIQDIQTPPLDMLKAYGEIHSIVETSVGKGGAKLTKDFQKRQERGKAEQAKEAEFQNSQAYLIAKNQEAKKPPIQEQDTANPDEDQDKGGDIFAAGVLDGLEEAYNV